MTSLLPSQVQLMVEARAPRRGLLMYIQGDNFARRFWGGVGYLRLDSLDDLDPSGLYTGSGILRELPPLRQITGGKAERIDISVSDCVPDVMHLINDSIIGATLYVGYVFFNDDWQIVGPAAWLWEGYIDVVRREQSADSRARVLSAVSGAATRGKAGRRYWSNAGHQSRHPGDKFFDRVQLMTVNTTRKFG